MSPRIKVQIASPKSADTLPSSAYVESSINSGVFNRQLNIEIFSIEHIFDGYRSHALF